MVNIKYIPNKNTKIKNVLCDCFLSGIPIILCKHIMGNSIIFSKLKSGIGIATNAKYCLESKLIAITYSDGYWLKWLDKYITKLWYTDNFKF